MFDRLFNSIVFRIGSMMVAISMIAILSMFSSMFISELADKDALIINHAGSMRMQSYKILAELELLPQLRGTDLTKQQRKLAFSLKTFSDKVTSSIMQVETDHKHLNAIEQSLHAIQQQWQQQLLPKFEQLSQQSVVLSVEQLLALEQEMNQFVMRIDSLVVLYQQRAENRISLIRMILGGSLFVTTVLAAFIMLQLSRRVEKPLSELTSAAKRIMSGDYTTAVDIQQSDELGLLAQTMNKMSQAISYSHASLSERVKAKTHKLRQSNDSLELLYQTSQLINSSTQNHLDLTPIAKRLAEITGIKDIDICLTTVNGQMPYEHIITENKVLDSQCSQGDCGDCLTHDGCGVDVRLDSMKMRYPIKKDNTSYGVIVCNLNSSTPLETWQHQLFSSIATLIANSLHAREQVEQSRRIALLNERNVIARELHDSLAQALSYLKMQVTCLQKLQQKQATQDKIDAVINELKTGLNDAYRQLRELLTTFRLKIEAEGLYQAFAEQVQSLNQRAEGHMLFQLDYHLHDLPLTPNEEIHLMQITREATQNALNHSKGTKANITAYSDTEKNIHLIIEDDGVGMPDDPTKLNHYGMAIMQERSLHLEGEVTVGESDLGGTKIEVVFKPNYIRNLEHVA